jgi:hypothetical protein
MDIASKSKSWAPVSKNGWLIKYSIYRDTNILLNVFSTKTNQLIIRHYTNEDDACMFLNYILDLDPELTYDL